MASPLNLICKNFLACGSILLSMLLAAAGAHAAPPVVTIPNGPIAGTPVHPNTLLSLSVEFPTVGAAYRQEYVPSRVYAGYFDPDQCYTQAKPVYKTNAGGVKVYDTSNDDNKYFAPAGSAGANHTCKKQFSGNFMNWAASSAIDMLRVGLTGGDRIIDQVGKTVLQRSYLPNFFYLTDLYFPLKTFSSAGGVNASQVTPYSVGTLYMVSCKNRILFSTGPARVGLMKTGNDFDGALCDSDSATNTDKNLGEYLMRVEVCSDTEGPNRQDLCTRYGTHYKPEGEIQRNADRMRFAVMGYLLDANVARYGGVLRAPMKYVGPNRYVNLEQFPNADAEWDKDTGVFLMNPVAAGKGSVMNYLNQFGRNGIYKIWDPIGELFYEGVRYLGGMQPTPLATAGMTPEMMDGFPVITPWTNPVTADCQKNSIIMIADAKANYDAYVPGNTFTITQGATWFPTPPFGTVVDVPRPVENGFDVRYWNRLIGNEETTAHGPDTKTRPVLAGLENQLTGWQPGTPDQPFKGTYNISGTAFYANQMPKGLQTAFKGIHVQSFVIDVDEGGNGVIDDSNTRDFARPRDSQLYLAAKYGGYEPLPSSLLPGAPASSWTPYVFQSLTPNPKTGCYRFLWDMDGDCNPDNYFLASDGVAFAKSFRTIFDKLKSQGDSTAQVATTGPIVSEGKDAYIYQGRFDTRGWSGDLRRTRVSVDPASGDVKIDPAPDANTPTTFLAEPSIAMPGKPSAPRKIFTLAPNGPGSASSVPFRWNKIGGPERAALNRKDGLGQRRLDWLRGITADENTSTNPAGLFRNRPLAANGVTNLLGDIIRSNPVFVDVPSKSVVGSGYQAFYDSLVNADGSAKRQAAVYVGSNDGMLHAFSPNMQIEYFAYVPKMVFNNLAKLTDQNYGHQAYVDGGMSVAEAKVGTKWKTVLASAMGGGAQGVFAIDVTRPESYSDADSANNLAIWEFSESDDADMGNVFSAPTIAKFRINSPASTPVYEYFVVVESGINNYAADAAPSTNVGGSLFLLSLNKAHGAKWILGQNYFKYTVPNSAVDTTAASGMSAPALVVGSDGAVRYAYAGDMQGNMWRFNFTGQNDAGVPVAKPLSSALQPQRIFAAVDGASKAQPITAAPTVVYGPEGGFVVLFGTGRFIDDKDIVTHDAQSFYGIYDSLSATATPPTRSLLEKRTLSHAQDAIKIVAAGGAKSDTAGIRGWYFDFLDTATTGERSVTPALLSSGTLYFNSLMPPDDPCNQLSSGRTYAIGALTGLPTGTTGVLSKVGALSSPVAFDRIGNSSVTNAQGKSVVRKRYAVGSFGTKGVAQGSTLNSAADVTAGRLSWREIFNFQELRKGP